MFARAGAQVYGFDISDVQIAAVQKLAERLDLADQIVAAAMPFEELEYETECFDAAYGHAILHHIDLPRGGTELNRVLRKGAVASFVEPLGMNPLLEFARRHLPYREKNRTADEKPLTYSDIAVFKRQFARGWHMEYCFLSMLRRRIITSRKVVKGLERIDERILRWMPFLRRMCAEVWVGVQKI
jgi:SAM-dependent methyltransferase